MLSNQIVKMCSVLLVMVLTMALVGCRGGEETVPLDAIDLNMTETPVVKVVQAVVPFGYKETMLNPAAEQELTRIVQQVQDTPSYQIELVGHADAVASASYNMSLSQQRAEAVRDFLVTHGITAERMTIEWKGEAQPVADNTTEDGRAQNRRTEVTLRPMTTPTAMMESEAAML